MISSKTPQKAQLSDEKSIPQLSKELYDLQTAATESIKLNLRRVVKSTRLPQWGETNDYLEKAKLVLASYDSSEALLKRLQVTVKLTKHEHEFLKTYRDQFTEKGKRDNELYSLILETVLPENSEDKLDDKYSALTKSLLGMNSKNSSAKKAEATAMP